MLATLAFATLVLGPYLALNVLVWASEVVLVPLRIFVIIVRLVVFVAFSFFRRIEATPSAYSPFIIAIVRVPIIVEAVRFITGMHGATLICLRGDFHGTRVGAAQLTRILFLYRFPCGYDRRSATWRHFAYCLGAARVASSA
jgi:hypothetical protein